MTKLSKRIEAERKVLLHEARDNEDRAAHCAELAEKATKNWNDAITKYSAAINAGKKHSILDFVQTKVFCTLNKY